MAHSAKSTGGNLRWLMVAAIAVILLATALPALCLFLPSLLVLATEQDRSRPLTRAVVLFGLAASWNTLGLLWKFGGLGPTGWTAVSLAIALDTNRLAMAWAAQTGGWLMAEGLAIAFSLGGESRVRQITEAAERRKEALRAEWTG
jgi:hypothetical protein